MRADVAAACSDGMPATDMPLSTKGFAVGTNVVYAATHQFGRDIKPGKRGKGGRIPARPMMPNASQGLGPIWLPAFDAVIAQTMKKTFGR